MGTHGWMARLGMVLAVGAALAVSGCAYLTNRSPGEDAAPPKAAAAPAKAVSQLILPTETSSRFLSEKYFVTNWLVLGPFKFGEDDFGGDQQQAAADETFVPDEAALDGTQTPREGTSWKEKIFKGDIQPGRVDLDGLYDKPDHAAAYAVCWLDCPEDLPNATLLTGSDDYIKVWVNGKLVNTFKEKRRASEWDQDKVPNVSLKKGLNRIVVKCVDVVFDWDFYFRVATADGNPIEAKPVVAEVPGQVSAAALSATADSLGYR